MITITEKASINEMFEILKQLGTNGRDRQQASLVLTTLQARQMLDADLRPEKQPA